MQDAATVPVLRAGHNRSTAGGAAHLQRAHGEYKAADSDNAYKWHGAAACMVACPLTGRHRCMAVMYFATVRLAGSGWSCSAIHQPEKTLALLNGNAAYMCMRHVFKNLSELIDMTPDLE
jgi:hypothetical protein